MSDHPSAAAVLPTDTRASLAGRPGAELEAMLTALTAMLVKYVEENRAAEARIVTPLSPVELRSVLDLTIADHGCTFRELLERFQTTLDHSVRTGHPLFLDKLYPGVSPVGIAAELLTAALNINAHVYATSPVGTLMELACLRELRRIIGYPSTGCGLLCPGGSNANLVAMCTARNYKFPMTKASGTHTIPPLAVFTSERSHYSIEKGAMVMGIGTRNVFKVRVTPNGSMIPADLELQIQAAKAQGLVPFFVNATSGTTVLSTFDPIREIATIAKREGLWLHVDGSWGGALIFSDKHRHLLDGLELTDSFTVNPHKLLGIPVQCSCLVVAHPATAMVHANATQAKYLFHSQSTDQLNSADDADDDCSTSPSSNTDDEILDLGSLGIGCGRRADSVKLFLSWRWEGTSGFAARVDRAMARAERLRALVRSHPRLEPVLPTGEMGMTVAFWYVPPGTGDREAWRRRVHTDAEYQAYMGRLMAAMRDEMLARGRVMVDHAPLSAPYPLPPFFRVPMHSPDVTDGHLDVLVEELVVIGDAVTLRAEFASL